MNTNDGIENTDIYKKCLIIFYDETVETIKIIANDILFGADYEDYINCIDIDEEDDIIKKKYSFINED